MFRGKQKDTFVSAGNNLGKLGESMGRILARTRDIQNRGWRRNLMKVFIKISFLFFSIDLIGTSEKFIKFCDF